MVAYGYIYGWLKVAFGIFCLVKKCRQHLLPGGMLHRLQRNPTNKKNPRLRDTFCICWITLHQPTQMFLIGDRKKLARTDTLFY